MEKPSIKTITVGIPAYNEAGNIKSLLKNISLQATEGFIIDRIIVISDGSTDHTVSEAEAEKSARTMIVDGKRRLGLAARQNQLISLCQSDILVILNADIAIGDRNFISLLAGPVVAGQADLSSCNYTALPPRNLLAEALNVNLLFKNRAFERYRSGQNAYTCHGAARAFSRRLIEKLFFHESVSEDIYSYLFCRYHGLNYRFAASASVSVKLPSAAKDYWRQSVRFAQSRRRRFYKYFNKDFVDNELRLPAALLAGSAWSFFLRFPGLVLLYFALYGSSRLAALFSAGVSDRWEVSTTAKICHASGRPAAADASPWLIRGRRALYRFARLFDGLISEPQPLILIFCYHAVGHNSWRYSVNLEMIKRQVGRLLEEFEPTSLSDIAGHLKKEKIIQRPSFALTFDDGYRDVLAAVDFFKDCRINPTIFAIAETDSADQAELGNDLPLASAQDLRALIEAGWEVGCHSATHADFSNLSTMDHQREIIESKTLLEKITCRPIRYFSYPKGIYSASIRDAAKRAGYELAVTMDDGYITEAADPLLLPRIGIDGTHSMEEFSSIHRYPAMFARRILRRLA